jgi:AcrR family transcriptional regulator
MTAFTDTDPQHVDPSPGRGRPRDPNLDAAILHAALEGLIEHGYDRLSMDEIAVRAQVGKGAVYRRWPSKAELVVDAIVMWRLARSPVAVPDAALEAMPDMDEADGAMFAVLLGLLTAASRDSELTAALDANLLELARSTIRDVLERAVRRGEIEPGRDLSLVPDMMIGLNLLRIVAGQPIDREFFRRVIDDLVLPVLLGPDQTTTPSKRE